MRKTPLFLAVLSLSFTIACAGGPDDAAPAATTPKPGGKRVDAATAGAVTGRVSFDGTVPDAEIIRMTADRNCVQDAGPNPQSDAVLVSADKSVKNVFVYVKDGLDPAYTFDAPSAPALLDQKGCIYSPRVLGVRVGQAIEIVNSDPTMHNVHSLPMKNNEFNHGQPRKGERASEVFTVPEVMVRFKCDVHSWMAAWVGVVDHPYFAVTDESGAFALPNLPAGTYTIEAWHEKLGTKTAQVTVAAGQTQALPITLTGPAK
jgi:plastocyanin